jgi:AcrR family transcriptional regulator
LDTENFDKTSDEKQQAVLRAGFTRFAEDGYKKTAMSEIAAAAGVSKAALFHYFGSKRGLYLYLFRFACDRILERMTEGTEDFFECLAIGSKIKLEVMERHPGMYEFLFSLVKSDDTETIDMLRDSQSQAIAAGVRDLFAKVNWSRFKSGIDRQDAVEMVTALSNGFLRGNPDKPKAELVAKLDRYLNLLKQALYKEEYL